MESGMNEAEVKLISSITRSTSIADNEAISSY
jgi:hypothetical protein